jgi:hypothetical protein
LFERRIAIVFRSTFSFDSEPCMFHSFSGWQAKGVPILRILLAQESKLRKISYFVIQRVRNDLSANHSMLLVYEALSY